MSDLSDPNDRASDLEAQHREDAIAEQRRRAGLDGKTVDDSATHCTICEDRIPIERRRAVPGVQTCIHCQEDLENAIP